MHQTCGSYQSLRQTYWVKSSPKRTYMYHGIIAVREHFRIVSSAGGKPQYQAWCKSDAAPLLVDLAVERVFQVVDNRL